MGRWHTAYRFPTNFARYRNKADEAAGVSGDDIPADNEWVVRATIEEMKGRGMELVGTIHDILNIKDGKVKWNGIKDQRGDSMGELLVSIS